MQIQMDILDGVRYASFLINIVVFYYWLKQRIFLNNFLVGRWEGVLAPDENPDAVYHCILYMASRESNDNTGNLYYCHKDLKTGDALVKGLDELIDYNDALFVFKREWNPRFIRVFHKEVEHLIDDSSSYDSLPMAYRWKCQILSIFFCAKMRVEITAVGQEIKFSGTLRKH